MQFGIGSLLANVGNGNLLVHVDDFSVANPGVPLAFYRSYNSLSSYDHNVSDGTIQDIYGDGWTTTFDVHMVQNENGFSVYADDGGRNDFTYQSGILTPVNQADGTLTSDNANGYYWQRKGGIAYHLYSPTSTAIGAGLRGRLYQIIARNTASTITLAYSFSNADSSTINNLTSIVATAMPSTSQITLFFTLVASNVVGLTEIALPDGTIYQYQNGYDPATNALQLVQVYTPPNNIMWAQSGESIQQYGYSGPHQLQYAMDPRWWDTCVPGTNCTGTEGGYTFFHYFSDGRLKDEHPIGYVNWTIADGIAGGTLLQPQQSGAAGLVRYHSDDFSYDTGAPGGRTTFTDSDGHARVYSMDAGGNVTRVDNYVTPTFTLSEFRTYDGAHDLVSTTDPRGTSRQMGYDTHRNLVSLVETTAQPADGQYQPTYYYSYDQNDNLLSACDPEYVLKNGAGPAGALCSSGIGSYRYVYDNSVATEPLGRLSAVVNQNNYTSRYTYGLINGVDYSLPTQSAGDAIGNMDGTTIVPGVSVTYTALGQLSTSRRINAASADHYTYDVVGRPTSYTDEDGVATYRTYYPNGDLKSEASSRQHADGVANTFRYDANHMITSVQKWLTPSVSATTTYYLDSAERTVETVLPTDSRDFYPYPWATRYLYDISGASGTSGTNTVSDGAHTSTLSSHGGRFAVQRYVPDTTQILLNGGAIPGARWTDIQGFGYDAIDRQTQRLIVAPAAHAFVATQYAYDQSPNSYGLLSAINGPLGGAAYTYDGGENVATETPWAAAGSVAQSPMRYSYDGDGNLLSAASTAFGTTSYTYDAAGNPLTVQEPSGGSGQPGFAGSGTPSSPALYTYFYHGNGWRNRVRISSSALNATAVSLHKDSFDQSGRVIGRLFTYNGTGYQFSTTYTPAGRFASASDPFGANTTTATYNTNGELSTWTAPAATYSNIRSSDAGQVTAFDLHINYPGIPYSPPYSPTAPSHIDFGYTSRGELVGAVGNNQGIQYASRSADGTIVPYTNDYATTFDPRTGASLNNNAHYDAAGRLSGPYTSYDSGDHYVGGPGYDQFAFGYDGHPWMSSSPASGSAVVFTNHFDVDGGLVFQTAQDGTLKVVKSGQSVDIPNPTATPVAGAGPLALWDRDIFGYATNARNGSGVGEFGIQFPGVPCTPLVPPGRIINAPYNPGYPAATPGFKRNTQYDPSQCYVSPVAGGILTSPRLDGLFDGTSIINGERNLATSLGSFDAPDSTSPEGSPQNELLYGYAANDATDFMDPSGLCPTPYQLSMGPPANGLANIGCVEARPYHSDLLDQLDENLAAAEAQSASLGPQGIPEDAAVTAGTGVVAVARLARIGYVRSRTLFDRFKRASPAPNGFDWHHLVEQRQFARFGPIIHSAQNLRLIPRAVHTQISNYYSSIQAFTNGLTVRQWLNTRSWNEQYTFGVKTLKDFMNGH